MFGTCLGMCLELGRILVVTYKCVNRASLVITQFNPIKTHLILVMTSSHRRCNLVDDLPRFGVLLGQIRVLFVCKRLRILLGLQ